MDESRKIQNWKEYPKIGQDPKWLLSEVPFNLAKGQTKLKWFFKHTLLPKNEQTNSTLIL